MSISNWDEIRTAYHVARLGTVSGAAEALGVHHATVIRHVDALEARIGVKLFQRHARGYTPTEAGEDLLTVGQATENQFHQLVSRMRGRGREVQGELVVTTIAGIAPLVAPSIARFQALHPALTVRYLSDPRLFRLEYGEAHVAIRAGAAPQEPDNVVQALGVIGGRFCAAPEYVARHGVPGGPDSYAGHRWIDSADGDFRAPYSRWLRARVPEGSVVFRATEPEALEAAVVAGIGIGFLPSWVMEKHPGLVEVLPKQADWDSSLWLVSHVDLHRTSKVQSFVSFLKTEAKGW